MRIPKQRRNDLQVASAVISFVLTGAFVLQSLGIPPLLSVVYGWLARGPTPEYVGLALGAAGVFGVIYQLLYASVIAPVKCMIGVQIPIEGNVNLRRVNASDFIVIIIIFAVYQWMVTVRELPVTGPVMVGGLLLIITAMVFRIIPRVVARFVDPDVCFYSLRIIIIGTITSVILFLPTLYVVAYFDKLLA